MSRSILILNYEYPPIGGGAGNATQHIARELVSQGHRVHIVTTHFDDLPILEENDQGTVHRIASRRKRKDRSNPLEMYSYVKQARLYCVKLCSKNRFDIILSFFGIPSGMVALDLKFQFHIPYVVLLRGADVPGYPFAFSRFWHMITHGITRRVWKHTSALIANSVGLQQLAQKTGDRIHQTVSMIPNGVDDSFFSPADDYSPGEPLRFLFVGRFVREKGVEPLLDALNAEVQDQMPFRFTFVGNGPYNSKIENWILKNRASSFVTLTDWVTKEKLRYIYQTHDCLVIPSYMEGMPNVMLEAMACGLPVIGTDIAGINEIFDNNGYLIPKASSYAIKQAMNALIYNPIQLASFRLASLERIKEFTWGHVAHQLNHIMQKAILEYTE
jgi:glycosyltransferase involved in cell wall biosynthesis